MKRMKITITVLVAGLLGTSPVMAQSIPEGVNHLYAERNKSAKETFDKLVATNPNNLEAVYWLGQTYIAMEDVKSARDLYSKTLQANGNAPLILVGMGHVNLIDGKKDEGRQKIQGCASGKEEKEIGERAGIDEEAARWGGLFLMPLTAC